MKMTGRKYIKTKYISAISLLLVVVLLFSACLQKKEITPVNTELYTAEELKKSKVIITIPEKSEVTVKNNLFSIEGATIEDLKINNKEIKTNDEGAFIYYSYLKKGENTFKIKSKHYSKTIKVTYKPEIIKSYTEAINNREFPRSSIFSFGLTAESGCKVSAELLGEKFEFEETEKGQYSGIIKIPNDKNFDWGRLTVTAKKGKKQEQVCVNIFFSKSENHDKLINSILSGKRKNYVQVGEKYVAQIVARSAETFDSATIDDYSRPTNNYLPYGTVDYCSPLELYDSESDNKYNVLRCNYRVYNDSIKIYKATLPDTNKIKYANGKINGNKLELAFDVDWKAPFKFRLAPQTYKSKSTQDYNISNATYKYIDITFCYAAKFGENFSLPANSIFSHYELIKGNNDYTLRLHLKKTDGFYGWDAEYNNKGQLVFSFLLPYQISTTNKNSSSILKGTHIVIDAGHGGSDGGAPCINGSNEAYYNLLYARELKAKLISLGASVSMTRNNNSEVGLERRCEIIRRSNADLVVSIHFNGSEGRTANGYFMGYFNPYTMKAAKIIGNSINSQNLLNTYSGGISWHYFRLSRVSACPVVLTENGFMSSYKDVNKIADSSFRKKYVDAIANGVMNYFISIKQ